MLFYFGWLTDSGRELRTRQVVKDPPSIQVAQLLLLLPLAQLLVVAEDAQLVCVTFRFQCRRLEETALVCVIFFVA